MQTAARSLSSHKIPANVFAVWQQKRCLQEGGVRRYRCVQDCARRLFQKDFCPLTVTAS